MTTSGLPSTSVPVSFFCIELNWYNAPVVDSVNSRSGFIGLRRPHVAGAIETPQPVRPSKTALVPVHHAFVARIFRLERTVKSSLSGRDTNPVVRQLKGAVRVQNPDSVSALPV
ncbi:hypothetical protein FGIG_06161 [Fasciola gigantica]|uniref:Uncharacterized protein n=1 Tax=Fasciola gigantica TaxID=46835 RepID=A0A504XXS4_FASGI|nr:hypothetical protein FGIG_06161 [Fasciola gigantica]